MTHQLPTAHAAALATTRTPQEAALIAIYAQRAAELSTQMLLMRVAAHEPEEQQA